ncbi:MAG: phosphopantetheine-binding protein [Propionibacteriaceae bacterium]|jgi:acyl carrier protein|nr:phosphopantetheine-binding protein [Propionibacteriaceae bacterium]
MTATYEELREQALERRELNTKLRTILVDGLELPVSVDQIDSDQPLFGRGLELDSLDTLEIVSLIDEEWDAPITDDQKYLFGSINKLADYIEQCDVKEKTPALEGEFDIIEAADLTEVPAVIETVPAEEPVVVGA